MHRWYFLLMFHANIIYIYTPNSKYASGKSLLCIDPNFDESRHKTILKLDKP